MRERLILASSSPRRRDLLDGVRADFDVIPSDVPEQRQASESPDQYVTRLSREKAAAVANGHPDRWVIAADTIVVCGGEVLEKPVDATDAKRMLALLAGRTHVVHSGLSVHRRKPHYIDTRVCTTEVTMLPMSEREIAWYVATREPLDKAGAYAAQGIGGMFIDSIHGSYTNVVGLPLALLFQMLKTAGIDLVQ